MPRPPQNTDSTKVKFRIMEVEVEGASPAVIESLRTMAGAFSRPRTGLPAATKPISATSAQPAAEEPEVPQVELDFGDAAPEAVAMAEGSTPNSRPRPQRKPPVTPALVPDIDIKTGNPPFAEFFASIGSPEDHQRRYLAIAYWLKRHRTPNLSSITAAHEFTCYRLMDWTIPRNVSQPLIDATRKTNLKWFIKDDNGYAITNVGENEILNMRAKTK